MKDKPEESRKPRISLALLDFEMRNRLESVLSNAGYDVVIYSQMNDLPRLLAADELRSYDVVVWDVEMLYEGAVRRIEEFQGLSDFPPLILVTAFSDRQALQRVGHLETAADFDMPLETFHQLATVLRIVPL